MDTKVLSSGVRYSNLPESYIRPESERPRLSEVSECENVPIIDLSCEDRSFLVQQIAEACVSHGFFQVINHGVRLETVEKILEVAHEFFELPVEEKLKLYSDDPSKTVRLSKRFNVKKEKVHNWRDYVRLHCYPLQKYVPEWPANPSNFNALTQSNSTFKFLIPTLVAAVQVCFQGKTTSPLETNPVNFYIFLLTTISFALMAVMSNSELLEVVCFISGSLSTVSLVCMIVGGSFGNIILIAGALPTFFVAYKHTNLTLKEIYNWILQKIKNTRSWVYKKISDKLSRITSFRSNQPPLPI